MLKNLYARTVFFVNDVDRALRFYTEQLGFSLDWTRVEEDQIVVCQVGLYGFELILNEVDERTSARAGHGRLFIGLDDDQAAPFRKYVLEAGIRTGRQHWGRPTLVIRDSDGNELFFWLPRDDFADFAISDLSS